MSEQLELPLFPLPPQNTLMDNPDAVRYEEGLSPDHQAAKRSIARSATRFSEAYGDLGGGMQTAAENVELSDYYGEFIDGFEPWKKDIDAAFEQFDIARLSTDEIHKMTKTDQELLALYFDHYVDALISRGHYLATPGAEGSSLYAEYPFANEQQATVYGRELLGFAQAIQLSEEYDLLHAKSKDLKPKSHDRNNFVLNDRKKHGEPVVAFDTRDQKLRVKRQSRNSVPVAS